GGTVGSSSINVNGGNFVINRTDTSTLSNIIGGGGGEVDINGTGTVTFSGANTYSASTHINAGKLIVTNAGTTSNTSSVGTISGGEGDIAAGAALDLSGNTTANNPTFGNKSFHMSGAGADGNGAILNNGTSQQNAFENITLDGDAVIGAFQRIDIRQAANANANLNLVGHTLTKIGGQQLGLVNTNVG